MSKVFRYFLPALYFLYCTAVNAQIPDGYYDSAMGLSDGKLKSALHEIIKGHIEFPYTSKETDTWDILKESDRDLKNPDNVILFYTGRSVNAAQE
jgi:hypothetical protein